MSKNSEHNCGIKKEIEGHSHSNSHSIIYTWKINQITSFLKSSKISGENIVFESPEFSIGGKIKSSWCLQLAIDEDDESSKDKTWVSLYLWKTSENRQVRTKYLLFLLNDKKEKIVDADTQIDNQLVHEEFNYIFPKYPDGYGYHQYMKIDDFLEKKDKFLPNDTLTVGVDLTVYDEYVGIKTSINSPRASKRKLSNDFGDLFAAKKKCDIKIQVSGKVFEAHKLILTTRSCIFDAMFFHDTKKNEKNKVNIPDVDPDVFERVLKFIYTDKVDDLDDFAEQLLEVSGKYQLQELKKMCEDSIAKTMSVENAFRILILADRQNAKRLFRFALRYIVINLTTLKNSKEYKALEESHPFLFLAILKKYIDGI